MKQFLLVACMAALLAPLSLLAQEKLEKDLKSVMVHLDKTQKESAQKIEELTNDNEKLTRRNRDLSTMNKDLSSANIRLLKQLEELKSEVATLSEENQILQTKLADVPVREVQTASLSPSPVPARANMANRITPASLEQKTKAKEAPTERFGPDFAENSPVAEPVAQKSSEPESEPIPDFSLSGARNNPDINASEHLSDGTLLLVNINTATERELRLIPGVGPAMATRILENRPYKSIWDLLKVQNIGRKRIETLAPYITTE